MDSVKLDYEWIALMKEAKDIGMTVEEVRVFLAEAQKYT
ncbi:Anti-repressor SinI [Ornithinibacillus halophilus]|uniref:Anti-repressor SinI n=1 Tax=Ornithinibacillus halophilus TaxID=930117 RepID=A0A1M5FEK2_9BACI|nr:Anti-repressor SinI [Ornithinibacillus halophilus]